MAGCIYSILLWTIPLHTPVAFNRYLSMMIRSGESPNPYLTRGGDLSDNIVVAWLFACKFIYKKIILYIEGEY